MNYCSTNQVVLSIVLALSLGSSSVQGVELVLREHATLVGPIVRLGDVADLSAASMSVLKELSATPLVPSPASGVSRFLQRTEVRDLLATRGVDIQSIRISGATAVELGKAPAVSKTEVDESLSVIPDQEIESLLLVAVEQYLQDQTGHDQWRVSLKLGSRDYRELSHFGTNLAVQGGRRPWTGSQQFEVGGANRDKQVTVRAKVTKIQAVLFTRQPIKKGDIIRATDVEIRQHEGRVSNTALRTMEQVIGMEAKRSIPASTIVQENQVQAPIQVQRGETVTVIARTGGISVRTYAVAKQSGAMGDLVKVETLDGKQQFAARVSGQRQLEILAAGAQARDYATLGKRTLQR